MDNPARPLVAIVGGAKVSSKLSVLDAVSKIADTLVVGGGISNTFVAAAGHEVGNSLHEKDLIPEANRLRAATEVIFATDVTVTQAGFDVWDADTPTVCKQPGEMQRNETLVR